MKAIDRFDRAFALSRHVDEYVKSDDEKDGSYYQVAVKLAAKKIEPDLVKLLLENWAATELGHGLFGTMANAIRRTKVTTKLKGKKVSLMYFMKADNMFYDPKTYPRLDGRPPVTGGAARKTSVYTVAGSLSYGSVRFVGGGWKKREKYDKDTGASLGTTKTPVGTKAKRTIKKIALEGTASKRSVNAVRRGYTRGGVRYTGGIDVQTKGQSVVFAREGKTGTTVHLKGGIVVTPANNFWKLNSTQQRYLGQRFIEELTMILSGELFAQQVAG